MLTIYIICIFFINCNCFLSISSQYTLIFEHDDYIVNVCIGNKKQCFPFKISFSIKETFVLDGEKYENGYKWKESESFTDVTTRLGKPFNDKFISGKYGKDTFYIKDTDIVIKDLKFIIVEKGIDINSISYIGIIGIGNGYEYFYSECGFMNKIMEMMKPNKRNFSIMKGKMYIGTDMNAIQTLTNGKVRKRCNIINDSSFDELIACQIDSSFIYDDKYKDIEHKVGKEKIKFSYDQNDIYIPYHIYSYIKELLLPKKGKGECYEEIQKGSLYKIKCNFNTNDYSIKNNIYFDLKRRKIYLFINDFNIQFILDDLFNWKEQYFIGIYNKHNNDWLIGKQFLSKYILTIDKNENYLYLTNNNI